MMKRTLLLLAALLLSSSGARAAWERIRSSDAPLAVVYASTGAFEVAYTVGENCASPYTLTYSTVALLSGYLSGFPSNADNMGFYGFESTSGVVLDGALWGARPDEDVKLLFATELSTALSSPGLEVRRVLDNSGTPADAPWPVTMTYSGQRLVILPSAAWPKGSVFSVHYSSAIIDINGAPVSGETTVYFSVQMDHTARNTAAYAPDSRVRVVVPANAYAQDFFLALSTDASRAEVVSANAKLAAVPGEPKFLNMVSVRSYSASGVPAQPGAACVVTLPYPDVNGDGLVDGPAARLRDSGLSMWLLDESKKLWVKQTGASLDRAARSLSLPVGHFSDYALLAVPDMDLDPVYAYPVPFRPNAGNAARYGSWTDLITFTNLPASGKLRIYTVSGDLVRELEISPPSMKWDVRNSDGQIVASGVYLWEITAGGNRKTGKLVVIK